MYLKTYTTGFSKIKRSNKESVIFSEPPIEDEAGSGLPPT